MTLLKRVRAATAACVTLVAVMASPVVTANDVIAMVVKGPDIKGNMTFPVPGAIEVLSMKGGVTNPGPGTLGGPGVPIPQDLSVIKRLDTASIALFQAVALGQHFTSISLLFYHINQGVATQFFQVDLGPGVRAVYFSGDAFSDTETQPQANDLETVSIHYCTLVLTSFTPTGPAPRGYDFCSGEPL